MITDPHLSQILKAHPAGLAQALNEVLPKYAITTRNRVAGFLAQCGHESRNFTALEENLNYRASALHATFPKIFPTEQSAKSFEHKPEKIANRVYANKNGNGNEDSGDGWKFRGRGAIQLTGRHNYQAFATAIGKSLDDTIAYCETLEGAIESACFYWKENHLNGACDADDIDRMTELVNGRRKLGLAERAAIYGKGKHALPDPVL